MTLQETAGAFRPARRDAAPTSALRWFHEFGGRVAAEWRRAGNSESKFVGIACAALEATPPSAHIDPSALCSEVLRPGALPPQVDREARFSDLPITVYDDETFFVQVLYWVEASPAVHDHNFVGAFHVLAGSSIESTYDFRATREFGPRVRHGLLTPRTIELLRAGDVRPIERGERLIHGVFHLERPSVSVVVRTHAAPNELILSYDPPGLAWDIFYETDQLARMLQSLRLHHKLGRGYFDAALGALDAADDIGVARILLQCYQLNFAHPEVLPALTEEARKRRPDLVDAVAPVLADLPQLHPLLALRSEVSSDDLRHALAFLVFAPTRKKALELVAKRVPDAAPEDTLTRWVGELMAYTGADSQLAQHRLVATEPSIVAFRSLLDGKGDVEVAAEVTSYFDGATPLDAAGVATMRRELRSSLLFRCLVTEES